MFWFLRLRSGKKVRKLLNMKNVRRRGKSARNGNMPSPYTKYRKVPYHYDTNKMDHYIERARELGIHPVDYMLGLRTQRGNRREAA